MAAKCEELQDMIYIDLKSALLALDEITGEVITDDIWNNIFDIELEVNKKLETYPVAFTVALQGILETSRPFQPEVIPSSGDNPKYNPGRVEFTGDWSSVFSLNIKLGINVFY